VQKGKSNMHRAIFLDRDGVINEDTGYVYKQENFKFKEGIFETLKFLGEKGCKFFIVTNQSGIARGYYSKDDFNKLMDWVKKEFLKRGIVIEDVSFCPHHPDIDGECECRKPKPGMILNLAKKYNIDLKNTLMIGDKQSDIDAAVRAGVGETVLIDGNIFDIMKQKGYM
jgi:D-glycero-D-manno-heptose 1,7-bisphosphate phosphatase